MCLTSLFCKFDDFCQEFENQWNKRLLVSNEKTRNRAGYMSLSERLTIFTRAVH